MRKIYQVIAATLAARNSCQAKLDSNPADQNAANWYDRHEERLQQIARDLLPSGSGFDSGTTIDEASTPERLIFNTSFHHMSEHGYYDGWTSHQVIITPSLLFGFNMRITGRDRRQIKEYIGDTFQAVLDSDEPTDTAAPPPAASEARL